MHATAREGVAADMATADLATAEATLEPVSAGAAVVAAPQFTWERTLRRMWTSADWLHLHAVSGVVHLVVGLAYLLDVVVGDVAAILGSSWGQHVPFELVLASLLCGAVNAVSGMQPALLPRPFKDLLQLMGFGEDGNLKSAGFVNTAIFYFILSYQSVRVLPTYPALLHNVDAASAAVSLFAIWHAIFIINSWVGRGKLDQALAIGMSLPLLLNVPVSLHLLLEGQSWVQQLSGVYPGWPEVFFCANYALGWAGSMVTFVLSLYERKVISLNDRAVIIFLLGAVCFTVIPLHAYLHVPQWFQGDQMVMLTLIPPRA